MSVIQSLLTGGNPAKHCLDNAIHILEFAHENGALGEKSNQIALSIMNMTFPMSAPTQGDVAVGHRMNASIGPHTSAKFLQRYLDIMQDPKYGEKAAYNLTMQLMAKACAREHFDYRNEGGMYRQMQRFLLNNMADVIAAGLCTWDDVARKGGVSRTMSNNMAVATLHRCAVDSSARKAANAILTQLCAPDALGTLPAGERDRLMQHIHHAPSYAPLVVNVAANQDILPYLRQHVVRCNAVVNVCVAPDPRLPRYGGPTVQPETALCLRNQPLLDANISSVRTLLCSCANRMLAARQAMAVIEHPSILQNCRIAAAGLYARCSARGDYAQGMQAVCLNVMVSFLLPRDVVRVFDPCQLGALTAYASRNHVVAKENEGNMQCVATRLLSELACSVVRVVPVPTATCIPDDIPVAPERTQTFTTRVTADREEVATKVVYRR